MDTSLFFPFLSFTDATLTPWFGSSSVSISWLCNVEHPDWVFFFFFLFLCPSLSLCLSVFGKWSNISMIFLPFSATMLVPLHLPFTHSSTCQMPLNKKKKKKLNWSSFFFSLIFLYLKKKKGVYVRTLYLDVTVLRLSLLVCKGN